MNPSARFAASLVTSLALWASTALACFRGEVDLASAGLRYLAAFFAAHLATGVISRLATAYRHLDGPGRRPGGVSEPAPASPPREPRRRRSDDKADANR